MNGHPEPKDFQPIEGIRTAKRAAGAPSSFTLEPALLWMIFLSGKFEVGFADGRHYQYHGPAPRHVESTTGPDHTSQFLGETTMIVIELKPGFGPWLSRILTRP